MNRILVDLGVFRRNVEIITRTMAKQHASWSLVTKVLCGHVETLRALPSMGVQSVGDTRLENFEALEDACPRAERWYLRPPHVSAAQAIVDHAHVSLNTEMEALEALDAAARRRGREHRVVIMVEIGELREGVLPSGLIPFFRRATTLQNIRILGIGANLGCLSGTVPTIEQLSPLPLYRKLLQHEFGLELPLVSAGSSVVLSALARNNVPEGITHYRIGEAAFLGTDLIHGGQLDGLQNALTIEAEVIEVRRKNQVPLGEISGDIAPFEASGGGTGEPGERSHRALVAIGQLDTEVGGLKPLEADQAVVGASSDISVVDLGENAAGVGVGDVIRFRPDYSAVARAMSGKYMRIETVDSEGGPARNGFEPARDRSRRGRPANPMRRRYDHETAG